MPKRVPNFKWLMFIDKRAKSSELVLRKGIWYQDGSGDQILYIFSL